MYAPEPVRQGLLDRLARSKALSRDAWLEGQAPVHPTQFMPIQAIDGAHRMSERQWLRITACENIPPREGRAAVAGDREIAVFNLGDRFLAVSAPGADRRSTATTVSEV